VVSLTLSACLFPVIDFEDHSATHALAFRTPRAAMQPTAAGNWRPVLASNGSVIGPAVPEPERPNPVSQRTCLEALRKAGVRFSSIASDQAPGVLWPIRLTAPIKGVTFEPQERSAVYATLDCRLGLALAAWASDLQRIGVRRVAYYSMYRPNARIASTGHVSGHAHGMAIDAARFTLQNGEEAVVLEDWEGRKRDQAPCPMRRDEARSSRLLRAATCSAVDRKLFQVVLTPHYNRAHDNHVHLELKPDVGWTYVR
jgi:hypothetical protein